MSIKKQIIVIDDEDAVRDAIEFSLMSTDFDVITFKSAEKALEYLKRNSVNLIITDLIMPNMPGIDFIQRYRENDTTTPIIGITGGARIGQNNIATEALNRGAQAICRKPMSKQELLSYIHNYI